MIERHVLAGINLAGILLDLIGGLYLAYDLLGGRKGPLRTITRCATYSVLFGLGYGLPLGLTFGLVAGTGLGLALGLEFRSAGPNGASVTPVPYRAFAFGLFRGLALGLAAWLTFDLRFGAAFGLLSGLGLILIYMLRFAPSDEYQALAKPRLTSRKLQATLMRGGVIGVAGLLAGTLTREGLRGPLFGLEVGLVVAGAGAIVATPSPFIEWWADRLPERRLGIFGATLVFAGFALQSLQYWAVLLNIPVR